MAVRGIGGTGARAHVHLADSVPAVSLVKCRFLQCSGHVEVQAGAGCKTVGSAYVGSNPTPATTCENGPLAAETRPGGPFPSCRAMYQGASLWVDAWQCARTYGVQRPGKTSGAYNRLLWVGRAASGGRDGVRRAGAHDRGVADASNCLWSDPLPRLTIDFSCTSWEPAKRRDYDRRGGQRSLLVGCVLELVVGTPLRRRCLPGSQPTRTP